MTWVKKILIPTSIAVFIAVSSWVGKTLIQSMNDMASMTSNVEQCTKSIDKLSERCDKLSTKCEVLQNTLTELKVRLEVTKLESMESTLGMLERVEELRYKGPVIPSSSGGDNSDYPALYPSPTGADLNPKKLNNEIIEQKKLIKSIKP